MSEVLRALEQVQRGDEAGALVTLVERWRETRSPSIAALVDLLGSRVPDALTKQLADVLTPRVVSSVERLRSMALADDPRVGRFALDALANPPFSAPSGEPLLNLLVDVVDRLRDTRVHAELPHIREVLRARLARLPVFERVSARLEDVARRQRASVEPEPGEAKLAALLRPSKTAEALLADVYAAPDDDAPRRVYADFLLERGDPRGELITLQLARPVGTEPSEREGELLKKHGKAWLGPLATVLSWGKSYSMTRFERGFVAVADFIENAEKKTALIATDPAWATVERFERMLWPGLLLAKAPLRALKQLDRPLSG
ncbi:MAG: TIGR02996 domain-containing protein, partial [Myxococcaceae bacterium]|nr:TIGR02996 domain-containing protein [Myxococcaceae bacterium]